MDLLKDDLFETVLERMDDEFESHDFIFAIMRYFPREYTHSLYECRRAKDPIQTLHAKIGRKLSGMKDHIGKTRKKASRNVRGLTSTNQYWKKLGDRSSD
jgi:hypothetical protein